MSISKSQSGREGGGVETTQDPLCLGDKNIHEAGVSAPACIDMQCTRVVVQHTIWVRYIGIWCEVGELEQISCGDL